MGIEHGNTDDDSRETKRIKTEETKDFPRLEPRLTLKNAHKAAVTSVRYSPDGKLIASSSDDGTIKVWDRSTGDLKITFEGHQRGVSDISWIRDSKHIASVSDDKTIRIWSIEKEWEIRRLRGHTHHIITVCFNHKGNLLATGGADENVLIWDTLQGRLMKTLAAHADPVSSVAFSHDGTVLVSASHDGLLRIWDSGSGHCLRTIVSPERSPVMAARFSPNGRYLLSSTLDGTLRLWDIMDVSDNSNKCVKTYNTNNGEMFKHGCSAGFIVSNDKTFIVQGSGQGGYISMWDIQTKELVDKIQAHDDSGPVLDVNEVDGNNELVTCGADGCIKTWKVR